MSTAKWLLQCVAVGVALYIIDRYALTLGESVLVGIGVGVAFGAVAYFFRVRREYHTAVEYRRDLESYLTPPDDYD